jgi:hypothetical protein
MALPFSVIFFFYFFRYPLLVQDRSLFLGD